MSLSMRVITGEMLRAAIDNMGMGSGSPARALSNAERATFADIGEADLPPRLPQPWRIISPNSNCLRRGHRNFHEDAEPECFIGPVGDGRMVLDTLQSILIGLGNPWIERKADFSFVDEHLRKPPQAEWKDAADALDGKAGFRMPNGNPVFENILAFLMLLNPELEGPTPAIFAFIKTGLEAGRELANRASRFRDDKLGIRGYPLAKWEISADWEQRNPKYPSYLSPRVKLLGRYGEAGGPTFDEMMLAAAVRKAFLAGEPWPPEIVGLATLPKPPEAEAIAAPASASAPAHTMTACTAERVTKWDMEPPEPPPEPPPSPPASDGRPRFTSGRMNYEPPEPPPDSSGDPGPGEADFIYSRDEWEDGRE